MESLSLHQELKEILAEDFNAFRELGLAILKIIVGISNSGITTGQIDFSKAVGDDGHPIIIPSDALLIVAAVKQLAGYLNRETPFSKLSLFNPIDVDSMYKSWSSLQPPKQSSKFHLTNAQLAAKMRAVAALRKRQGDIHSHRAHLKAAGLIAASKVPITSGDEARKIKGIGNGKIALKIDELIRTGTLEILDNRSPTDVILETLQGIWGTGLATARHWLESNYTSIEDIRMAVEADEIALTKQQKVGLEHFEDFNTEMSRFEMKAIGDVVQKAASKLPRSSNLRPNETPWRVIIVGSYRRGKLSSKDVDLMLIPTGSPPVDGKPGSRLAKKERDTCFKLAELLKDELGDNVKIPSQGEHQLFGAIRLSDESTSGSAVWRRFDVFIAAEDEIACGLLAHTGPADYNKRMREAAQKRGWVLNERHLSDHKGKVFPTHSEADVQKLLEFEVLPPEERI